MHSYFRHTHHPVILFTVFRVPYVMYVQNCQCLPTTVSTVYLSACLPACLPTGVSTVDTTNLCLLSCSCENNNNFLKYKLLTVAYVLFLANLSKMEVNGITSMLLVCRHRDRKQGEFGANTNYTTRSHTPVPFLPASLLCLSMTRIKGKKANIAHTQTAVRRHHQENVYIIERYTRRGAHGRH